MNPFTRLNTLLVTVLCLVCAACNTLPLSTPTPSPTAEQQPTVAALLAPTFILTATPEPSATPLPTDPPPTFIYPPTVTAPPSACEDAPRPTRLILQERGVVVEDDGAAVDERVNVREGPGTNNPVIAQLDIGDVFIVLDGPECSIQYAWFQVQFGEVVGWIAEGDLEAYYVAPYFPG